MEDSLRIAEPVALVRPRGAHRFEVFSPKLKRRLTFHRRCAFDQWVLIESDPAISHFCERPGFIQFRERRHLADFLVSYSDRQELILLPDPVIDEEAKEGLELNADAVNVRLVDAAEHAARAAGATHLKGLPHMKSSIGMHLFEQHAALLYF
ncbi:MULTISPECIES: hypothetical protein [unclassified Cupriavidus]|uniref:hypothetical protein n=1 Tax=unclassified Cupriavidus TaxID=2640874 RepID=UPI001898C766|nr:MULTISPECIES: hypothetical protein [unclassified Cupriavidus]MBF6989258.1 hypothetical protein [Cupriavidus sp. IK-TO18]